MKNKRGISLMVGYVLLVTIAIVMGAIVYNWMRSYVPRETIECPDGVSVYIQGVDCQDNGDGTYTMELNLTNNGRFDVDGYFIRASENPDAKIAGIDISENIISGGNAASGVVTFSNDLVPGEETRATYSLDNAMAFIEITPIIYETIENKIRLVNCGRAKVKENLVCSY